MTWKTRLASYVDGGATVAQAFDAIASDLTAMRDASLADAGCPEEVAYIGELFAEDAATLANLRAKHLETVRG